MCSIAGIARSPTSALDAVPRVRAMLAAMSHRGPDGQAALAFGAVTLGHARLSIRDPSPAAAQPARTPDGRFVLAFNGEIHNYRELRAELEAAGVALSTAGDTEVLLHVLAREGERGLARLNGEFALAFLDRENGTLLLARDPYGVKPLTYALDVDGLWFASEPVALLEPAGPAAREIDERVAARFLAEGVMEGPEETFFRGMRSLPPCQRMLVRDGRVLDVAPYRPFPHEEPRPAVVGEALAEAVRLRLDADVPVGSALSGGLDSGLMVAVAHSGLPTITAVMPDAALDESAAAAETARKTAADPTFVLLGAPTPADLEQLIREQGAPIASLSVWAKRQVAAAARARGVVVLLDGQGADEVFGGYGHFHAARCAGLLRRGRLARLAAELGAAPRGTAALTLYLALPRWLRTRARRLLLRPRRRLLGARLRSRYVIAPAADLSGPSLLKSLLAAHLTGPALGGLLRYADRASMAVGVEERYPYLDPTVVAAAFALPEEDLVSEGWTKRALRRAGSWRLPAGHVANRQKSDFRTPDATWLNGSLAADVAESLAGGSLEERGWLAPGGGARLLARLRSGRDDGTALRAYALAVFARVHLDGALSGARMTRKLLERA